VSVEIEGTIYRSRAEMTAAQQALFGTMLKGSRLVRGEVPFTRIVDPGVGVAHHRVSVLMPGEEEPPSRLSMQLFVVVWRDDRWVVAALQSARGLSTPSPAHN
jgi:hypothetical protein